MPLIFQGGITSWMFEQICVVHLLQIITNMGRFKTSCAKCVGSFMGIQFYFLECDKDLNNDLQCSLLMV
jgi:hypothetical protein